MQLAFSWSNLFGLALGIFAFWMGLRDLQGKDPLIHVFFNQYTRDPEYRAFWQKKNGVFFICNAVLFCTIHLLEPFALLHRILSTVWIVADLIYLILYEVWEHSAD